MERIDEANRSSVALAHISGLAGYVVPFGGIIAPILMMMGAEDGSQEERAAKQALALNVFVFIMSILLFISAFTIVLIPLVFICAAVLGLLGLGLPIYGLAKALSGEFCRFPFVGVFAE